MTTSSIEIYELLKSKFADKEAEKIVTFISEQTESKMTEAKQTLLTKEDKIDLLNRMNGLESKMNDQFKWLVGIMLSAIGLATILAKIL